MILWVCKHTLQGLIRFFEIIFLMWLFQPKIYCRYSCNNGTFICSCILAWDLRSNLWLKIVTHTLTPWCKDLYLIQIFEDIWRPSWVIKVIIYICYKITIDMFRQCINWFYPVYLPTSTSKFFNESWFHSCITYVMTSRRVYFCKKTPIFLYICNLLLLPWKRKKFIRKLPRKHTQKGIQLFLH